MSEADQFWSKIGEKLANLDHVPGEPLPSTEYLWNRVQQRIQRDRKRRRMYRYGIAAAFTITFSVLLSLSVNKNNKATLAAGTPTRDTKATAITVAPAAGNTLVKTVPPTTARIHKLKKKNNQSLTVPEPLPVQIPGTDRLANAPLPEIIAPAVPEVAGSFPLVPTHPGVIHIRDLKAMENNTGDPVYEMRRAFLKKSAANTAALSSPTGQEGLILKQSQHTN
jgi:hypothetical protein